MKITRPMVFFKTYVFILSICSIIMVSLVNFSSCKESATDPTKPYHIIHVIGTIISEEDGSPIEGADVKLYYHYSQDEVAIGNAKSDKDGKYSVKGRHNCERVPNLKVTAEKYYVAKGSVHCWSETQTIDFKLKPL